MASDETRSTHPHRLLLPAGAVLLAGSALLAASLLRRADPGAATWPVWLVAAVGGALLVPAVRKIVRLLKLLRETRLRLDREASLRGESDDRSAALEEGLAALGKFGCDADETGPDEARLQRGLERLRRLAGCGRLALYRADATPGQGLALTLLEEARAEDLPPGRDRAGIASIRLSLDPSRLRDDLERGAEHAGPLESFPPGEQTLLEATGARAFRFLPILHEGRCRGVLACFDPAAEPMREELTHRILRQAAERLSMRRASRERGAEVQRYRVLLQTLIEAIPSPAFAKDGGGIYRFCNEIFARQILGLSAEEVLGRGLREFGERIPGELADRYEEADRSLLQSGGAQTYEAPVRCADGTERFFLFHKACYHGPDGTAAGLVGVMLDMSDLRHTEDRLRESEARFREIADRLPLPMRLCAVDEHVEYVNPAFTKLFGYTIADMPDLETYFRKAYATGEEREEALRAWHDSGKMDEFLPMGPREARVRCRDGSVKTCLIWDVAIEENLVCTLFEDISERTLVEDALRQSEEQYRSISYSLERVGEGQLIIDADYRIRFMNKVMLETFGDRTGEVCFRALHGEEDVCGCCQLQKVIDERTTARCEREFPDGRIMDIIAGPFYNTDGSVSMMEIVRDITRQRETERALIRSERLAAAGTLAAGVAHEFNNINTGIMGFLDLALHDKTLQEKTRSNLELVLEGIQRASSITKRLLAFTSQRHSERRPHTLADVVDEILVCEAEKLRAEGIELEIRHGECPLVVLDGQQIGQALLSLLGNARHAVLGIENPRIGVRTFCGDGWGRIELRDNGCGISGEDLERVFSPFFTTKGEHAPPGSPLARVKGVGLGLSVANTIAQEHGGAIDVSSDPGHGSRFTIRLPLTSEDAREKTP